MPMTKRKPATVGEILVDEFIGPIGLTQRDLAAAMGVPRKHVNELCNDRRAITADTALMLARVFGNSADFWLNVNAASICGRPCIRRGAGNASSVPNRCAAWRREAT